MKDRKTAQAGGTHATVHPSRWARQANGFGESSESQRALRNSASPSFW